MVEVSKLHPSDILMVKRVVLGLFQNINKVVRGLIKLEKVSSKNRQVLCLQKHKSVENLDSSKNLTTRRKYMITVVILCHPNVVAVVSCIFARSGPDRPIKLG